MTDTHTTSADATNETPEPVNRAAVRRRASRAAGPAAAAAPSGQNVVTFDSPAPVKVRPTRPLGPPPRRRAHVTRIALLGLGSTAILMAALVAAVVALWTGKDRAAAAQARDQRFVDTASQTVVNMFSYTQDTIDQSVNRFIDGISGPLRDTMSQGNNVDNLKAIFRDTNANSEAVISGAVLESDPTSGRAKVDDTAGNAAVLVSVRVTVTNVDGVNAPSKPYRLRVIVHQDDAGRMTGYDLKYPDGGN